MFRTKLLTVAASAALFSGIGIASASLAATSTPSSPVVHGCVSNTTHVITKRTGLHCKAGSTALNWNQTGPQGAQGLPGAAGTTGPQGPSGVVSTSTTDLGAVASVPTGGGFVANATEVGTVSLKAGTYLISLNAKATPPANGTGAVAVFPQFFVYNQVKNSGFTGDLFNVGSGALESGANFQIDSYFTGSAVIKLATDTTLHVYAFGYDSDRGVGSYVLDDLSVTATQITTA